MRKPNPKDEPRREILRELIRQHGGHAEFVKEFRLTQSQASHVSQIVNGYSFGEKAAENMRSVLKLPPGYFDITEEQQPQALTQEQQRVLDLMGRMDKQTRSSFVKLFTRLVPERRKKNIGHDPERRLDSETYSDEHDLLDYANNDVREEQIQKRGETDD